MVAAVRVSARQVTSAVLDQPWVRAAFYRGGLGWLRALRTPCWGNAPEELVATGADVVESGALLMACGALEISKWPEAAGCWELSLGGTGGCQGGPAVGIRVIYAQTKPVASWLMAAFRVASVQSWYGRGRRRCWRFTAVADSAMAVGMPQFRPETATGRVFEALMRKCATDAKTVPCGAVGVMVARLMSTAAPWPGAAVLVVG